MEIGFIGLGKMGFPMARRLIEAGHTLTIFDTQKAAMDRLVALGAKAGTSPKGVADEVVVERDQAVDAVGAAGVEGDGSGHDWSPSSSARNRMWQRPQMMGPCS